MNFSFSVIYPDCSNTFFFFYCIPFKYTDLQEELKKLELSSDIWLEYITVYVCCLHYQPNHAK